MLKNYFKTALRQLRKNRLYSIVNIVGLSVGLASIMTLALLVYQYITTDKNQKEIGQMYYLKTFSSDGQQYMNTTYRLLGEVVKSCPEVEAATHIQSWYRPWLKYQNKEFQDKTEFVDTGFFKVFQLPFKYGNPDLAMENKYSIVLSEDMAEKFFGEEDPIGKTLAADDTTQLTVTGVLQKVPTNSTVRPTILLTTALLEDNPDFKSSADWYNGFATNFLRLRKNSDHLKLDAKIAQIVTKNYSSERGKDRVLSVPYSNISSENGNTNALLIRGSIGAGIFILLIILVNLINLNAATLYSRAKEVAVRQMMGSSKKNIIVQFCVENGLIVFFSIILGWLIFSLVLLPLLNGLIGDKFGEIGVSLRSDYPLVILFAGIGLLFTVIAASLPASKLITLKVTDTVKGKLSSSSYKSSVLRSIFITVQFVLAITLICITFILNRQIHYMKTESLGFNREDVAVVNMDLAYRDINLAMTRFGSILNNIKSNANVVAVSSNEVVPTAYWDNYNNYYDPSTNKEVHLRHAGADAGYFKTFEIPIIEGRNFDDAIASAEKNSVIINRAAMNAFGWTSAVGRQIKQKGNPQSYTIVGVVEDFHYSNLQNNIEPLLHWYTGKQSLQNYFSIKTKKGHVPDVIKQLESELKSIPARRNFAFEYMDDKIGKQYALFDTILKVTNFVAILTILIACMGMFGLIALFARQRVKEIGIRKVLGASVPGIAQLLLQDFIKLVCIASIVASPIAWYIMNRWLQDFAYHISIQWWMFVISGLIALIIAFITVVFQAVQAALLNPVDSLRAE